MTDVGEGAASVSSRYPPIGDYAIIGDCHTAALISRDGSIDWLCPERFDAPAVFCRILDAERGGYLSVKPAGVFSAERRYRGATNVLETTFHTASARLRVTDLMPVHRRTEHQHGYDVGTSHRILRRLECVAGAIDVDVVFKPTFDFARARTTISVQPGRGAIARDHAQFLTLRCPADDLSTDENGAVRGRLHLEAGHTEWVVLTSATDARRARAALTRDDCRAQLARTLEYWHHWAGRCRYSGPYRDQVVRSALVLKLLTYEPTGAIVAAPTTSLPELIGGQRNWDYRYTWLRDASLVLYALLTLGYGAEATDFMRWLESALVHNPTLDPQILYGIDGRADVPEEELPELDGYRSSRPVRIGNGAASQRQIDIFGEVLRAAALHYPPGAPPPPRSAWAVLRALVERAAEEWPTVEQGIWEVRGGPRPFTYGKLMCWAALQAGIEIAEAHALDAPLERWRNVRDEIREAILQRGYNPLVGAFTQSLDSDVLDASVLIMPRLNFLPASDERVRSTVQRIREELMADGLVYRYRTDDGLVGGEGTFTLCTFWMANALALDGQIEPARETFERVLGFANDVGLLAEEIDPRSGEQLGNFPQGFSHLALIGAAVDLETTGRPPTPDPSP